MSANGEDLRSHRAFPVLTVWLLFYVIAIVGALFWGVPRGTVETAGIGLHSPGASPAIIPHAAPKAIVPAWIER
jgi:hypothetical protein